MTNKECRQISHQIYNSHRTNSWIISIICGLFIGALLLLGLVFNGFQMIFVPFAVLPFFFSCIVSHYDLSRDDYLSGKKLFTFFKLFFSINFYSSFRMIKSFLKALLIEIICSLVVIGITYLIFSNSGTFKETIKQLINLINNNELNTTIYNELLEANDNELYRFIHINMISTNVIFGLSFIYFVSKESISIYLRLSFNQSPVTNGIAKIAIKSKRKEYFKLYLLMNYPILILLLLGALSGVSISIFMMHNYEYASVIGLSSGIALSSLYLPLYFSNMEAMYRYLNFDLKSISEEYVKMMMGRFGVNINVQSSEDNVDSTNQEETVEGNKKDPEDGSNE